MIKGKIYNLIGTDFCGMDRGEDGIYIGKGWCSIKNQEVLVFERLNKSQDQCNFIGTITEPHEARINWDSREEFKLRYSATHKGKSFDKMAPWYEYGENSKFEFYDEYSNTIYSGSE